MTVKQRKPDEIVQKKPNAGFMSRGCYILIMGDTPVEGCIGLDPCLDGATATRCQVHEKPCVDSECYCPNDYVPCMICDDEDCREWYNTIIMHGDTLAEVQADLVLLREAQAVKEATGNWGMAYHVSECEMEDAL